MFNVIEDSNVMFNVSRLISELLVSQTFLHGGTVTIHSCHSGLLSLVVGSQGVFGAGDL